MRNLNCKNNMSNMEMGLEKLEAGSAVLLEKLETSLAKMAMLLVILAMLLVVTGCGTAEESSASENGLAGNTSATVKTGSMELEYAQEFSVDYYEGGYAHISIGQKGSQADYVLIPEGGKETDLGIPEAILIHHPCDRIYLAATAAMDMFLQLDSLDDIMACSTTAEDYSMEEVKACINAGNITYVGKYKAPDYEMLLRGGCGLAIESTMIYHSPEVKEQLEKLGIPVLVERSSYESSPLGRLEWIRLYGLITGREEEAESFFKEKCGLVNQLTAELGTDGGKTGGPSVAFFYITSNGYVNVHKPGDYVCRMIEMAGGSYALSDLIPEEENALSTMNIGWEDFYRYAKDADILIYNGTIDGGVASLDDLIKRNVLLKDFAAVQAGNVWCTEANLFQESSRLADMIRDMALVFKGDNQVETDFLRKLE